MTVDLNRIQMIPASHHGPKIDGDCDVVVIHSMENAGNIKLGGALECAHYFASPGSAYQAHYTVDPKDIYQCVATDTVAYHVGKGNVYDSDVSIGIEQTGAAANTREQWLSTLGRAQIVLVGQLAGAICDQKSIPKVFLSVADLKAGKRGITSHANMAAALGGSTHTDPGSNYPWDVFFEAVNGGSTPVPTPVIQGVNMIAVARNVEGRLEQLRLAPDGTVLIRWQLAPNGQWSGEVPSDIGAPVATFDLSYGIAAEANADGRIEVFAKSIFGPIVHKWQKLDATGKKVIGWSDWTDKF